MTQKQRDYIDFIQEWSGVPYHDGKDTDLAIDKPVYAIHLTDIKEDV